MGVESLRVRDLRVLGLALEQGEVDPYGVKRETGMAIGTVYNVLRRLVEERLLEKTDGKYRPTSHAVEVYSNICAELCNTKAVPAGVRG